MQEAMLYINEIDKRKSKPKTRNMFPMINRSDIMSGILSENINENERIMLSKLYAEIIFMERKDLKYISEIAVSSQRDSEVFDILQKIRRTKENNKEQE